MVFKEEPKESIFVLSKDVYSKVISKDHLLYRINEEIDFSFVNEECKDIYDPKIGREVRNYPEMMFKAEIIQYMYGLSERQLKEQVGENLVYRWFIGYELDDNVFHFTAPGKFRNALGEERHRKLFDQILEQFKEKGLLDEYENQSIDATEIIADIAIPTTIGLIKKAIVSILRCYEGDCPIDREYYLGKKEKKEYKMTEKEKKLTLKKVVMDAKKIIEYFAHPDVKANEETLESIDQLRTILKDYVKEVNEDKEPHYKERKKKGKDRIVSTVDKDARWGAKSDDKTFCGYKNHTSQTDRQIITDVKVTPGNVPDDRELLPNLRRQKEKNLSPNKMRSDGIYGTIDNRKKATEMGTKIIAPPRTSHNKGKYYSKEDFKYYPEEKKLVCPAGHKTNIRYWNKNGNAWVYHFDEKACKQCPKKSECTYAAHRTVSISKEYEIQQEAIRYSKTEEYKEDMKVRAHIEPKQAEMKRFHKLKRAIYRGLERVNIQAIYTAIVVNLKRMVKLLDSGSYREDSNIS